MALDPIQERRHPRVDSRKVRLGAPEPVRHDADLVVIDHFLVRPADGQRASGVPLTRVLAALQKAHTQNPVVDDRPLLDEDVSALPAVDDGQLHQLQRRTGRTVWKQRVQTGCNSTFPNEKLSAYTLIIVRGANKDLEQLAEAAVFLLLFVYSR